MGTAPAIQLSMLRVSKRRTWRTAGENFRNHLRTVKAPQLLQCIERSQSYQEPFNHYTSQILQNPDSFPDVSRWCVILQIYVLKLLSRCSLICDCLEFTLCPPSKCLRGGRKPLKANRRMNKDMHDWSKFIFMFKWIHTETCLWYSVICTFWSTVLHKYRNSIISFQAIH